MPNRIIKPAERGLDIVLFAEGKALGGQKGATLQRSANVMDITNNIKMNWTSIITNVKNWSIICNGMIIKDNEAFDILSNAFNNNREIEVVLQGDKKYKGKAYIVNFPINTSYNETYAYNIVLSGNGELKNVEE